MYLAIMMPEIFSKHLHQAKSRTVTHILDEQNGTNS